MKEITSTDVMWYAWNYGIPIVMFAIIVYTGHKGVWVWKRELVASEARAAEWKAISEKWERVVLKTANLAETVAEVVKR